MAPPADFNAAQFDSRLIASALADSPPSLRAPVLHLLESGGKRIRPLLVHRFGALSGGPRDAIGELALAVEMLHTATLAHDDIIDSAGMRRGRPALQREYGADVALLVGDLYVARSGVHAAATGEPRASLEMFAALDQMVRGELDQRGRRFDLEQTVDDYIGTIRRKTASLLEAACAGAVVVSGGDAVAEKAARAYGLNVGLAFQVVDDVLDYSASAAGMGKPVAADIREGTVTLPLILAMQMSPAPVAAIVASAREADDYSAVVQAVRTSGAVERCLELAAERTTEAVTALEAFPDTADRQALAQLAEGLPSRQG